MHSSRQTQEDARLSVRRLGPAGGKPNGGAQGGVERQGALRCHPSRQRAPHADRQGEPPTEERRAARHLLYRTRALAPLTACEASRKANLVVRQRPRAEHRGVAPVVPMCSHAVLPVVLEGKSLLLAVSQPDTRSILTKGALCSRSCGRCRTCSS